MSEKMSIIFKTCYKCLNPYYVDGSCTKLRVLLKILNKLDLMGG